ncbi:hypothetical protein GCM10010387_15890 [Streptomyces inusitatus]|uniref:Uncharacterized protein n=1 Tax=Streptomyces inusitatus TaxID=68221 RepID=A0A918PWZ4_9ACTN|nr:hypothetical protein [Streptomyces inusitatus]GGZ23516.1 hypothetical protein GCM10010387_15890 [Streptomyces inusitatus]
MNATQLPTARQVHDLGDAVGRIAGLAALSLYGSFPHLDLDRLTEAFTTDKAISFIGRRYLAAIEEGKTPGESAGEVGKALIYAWADARREARTRLDREKVESPATS